MAYIAKLSQRWTIEEPYLRLKCLLGEGPYYEKSLDRIRFVDIRKQQMHSVSVRDPKSLQSIQLDEPVAVTADIAGQNSSVAFLVALKYGIAVLDRATGRYNYISSFARSRNERVRSNDGAVDPRGMFWLGTMTDFNEGEAQAEGSLFRFSGSTTAEEVLKDLEIPNSVGWSPDEKTMYFTLTKARQILAFHFSILDSVITGRRVLYQHDGPGLPDGFRVDVEGNIWQAIWGEGQVLKISPEGQVIGSITLPTRNITCVEFVGTELFITTAEDSDGDARSREFGGFLYRVQVGVEGLDHYEFQLGPRSSLK